MKRAPRSDAYQTRRWAPRTLRAKLFVFVAALVIVPGVLFGISALRSSRASLEVVIGQRLSREASHAARELGTTLRAERQTLVGFARQDVMRDIRIGDIDKRVSIALQALQRSKATRREYLVVDRSRRVVASSQPSSVGRSPPWPAVVSQAFDGAFVVHGPITDAEARGASLILATAIADPDRPDSADVASDGIGVLIGVYEWDAITAATQAVGDDLARLGLPTEVFVVRDDGEVLGGIPATSSLEKMPVLGRVAERTAGPAGADGATRADNWFIDDGEQLLVGRAAVGDGELGWNVVIIEPLAAALAPVQALTVRLILVLLATLGAALALAAVAGRRVVRPLSELTYAIRTLSHSGSAGLQVPVRTEDEVGEVATAFNDMSTELDRAQRDLAEAAKFAFVGELAGGVAHEVRTSLGVLRSCAQILGRSESIGNDPQAIEFAAMIREEVDRLGRVVDDLLGLARPRVLQLEPTPLSGPAFRAVDFAEPQAAERGVTLRKEIRSEDPTVECDGELMHQVVLNLVVNAIQILSPGGSVSVTVLDDVSGGPAIEVRDDGPGVPAELRDRLFVPFVTGREKGIGLGLTFVKRVVFEHGGRTLLETSDAGTCFRIELPRGSAPRASQREQEVG